MSDVNKQLLERWAAFGKAMQKSGSELPRHLISDTEKAIAAAEQAQQAKTITLEQLVANLKAGENGDAISAAMDQACADMELGRRMREQAQQAEPVARDVLMALGIEIADKAHAAGAIGNTFMDEEVAAIVDRYAAQKGDA